MIHSNRIYKELAWKDSIEILQDGTTALDIISCVIGKKIGEGSFRKTFEYALDDRYVVKLEIDEVESNIVEHLLWEEIKGLTGNLAWVKDWFAPVKWMSHDGRVLLMERTQKKNKKKPTEVPKFLLDVKEENFGWLSNKYVCHDYGALYGFLDYKKKFKKINW